MKERTKKYLFGVITPLLGLLVIELLTRGAFNLFGRYNDWGYAASSNLHRPYIGFAYKPYETGRDRYAFKLDSNDYLHRDLTEKEACEFRIFMLGGSTVDGRHLNGVDDPLPARLERRLNDQLSFNVGFSVINAGKGGFISVQSLMQHAFYINYSLKPDLIVHFSGSNDSVGTNNVWPAGSIPGVEDNMHRYTEMISSYIDNMTSFSGLLGATFQKLANYSAVVFLMHKTVNDPKSWTRWISDRAVLKSDESGMAKWVEKHVRRYIYNVKLSANLANEQIRVVHIFQPTLLPYMEPKLSVKENQYLKKGFDSSESFHGYDRGEAKQLFYFRVREELKNLNEGNDFQFATIHDMSSLFDDKQPTQIYFGDHVHYLPEGRGVIAKEIRDLILPIITEQVQSTDRFSECSINEK